MECECQNIIIEAVEYYKNYIVFIIVFWITFSITSKMFATWK